MGRGAKGTCIAAGIKRRQDRPQEETRLDAWLRDAGVSGTRLASILGVTPQIVSFWRHGQCIPSLVNAFQIERVTGGKVPAVSWLGLPLARAEAAKLSLEEIR